MRGNGLDCKICPSNESLTTTPNVSEHAVTHSCKLFEMYSVKYIFYVMNTMLRHVYS